MSIIHDALKRVQQGLAPKSEASKTETTPSTQAASSYVYETPSEIENLTSSGKRTAPQKTLDANKIKSFFALVCALSITAGSIVYLLGQFKSQIPVGERLAKKYFFHLIHKDIVPDFKTKTADELKPLAQITVNAPATSPAAATAAGTVNAPPAETLKIHGIMADAKGNLALINDQVYQEGDEVDGAKIIKIDLNSITVNINGTDKTISVKN